MLLGSRLAAGLHARCQTLVGRRSCTQHCVHGAAVEKSSPAALFYWLQVWLLPACQSEGCVRVPALRAGCAGLQVMGVQKDSPREPCWHVPCCVCCRWLTAGLLALHSGCAGKAGARLVSGLSCPCGQPAFCLSPLLPAPCPRYARDKDGRSSHCNLVSSDHKAGSQLSSSNPWAVPCSVRVVF